MAKRRISEAVLAARKARLQGENPIPVQKAVIERDAENEELEKLSRTVDTFWQGPDPFEHPPTYLQEDTDEFVDERTPFFPPSQKVRMTKEAVPISRESKAFRARAAHRVCIRISHGETLQQICGTEGLPSIDVINYWLQNVERFKVMYDRARLLQADYLADEMLLLATLVRKNPKNFAAYRVAADILRWQASVRSPRKYGERTQIEVADLRKTPQQIQKEIIDLATEFNVPIADVPKLRLPINRQTTKAEIEDVQTVDIMTVKEEN